MQETSMYVLIDELFLEIKVYVFRNLEMDDKEEFYRR